MDVRIINAHLYDADLAGVLVDYLKQFVVHRLPVFLRTVTDRVGSAMSEMIPHEGSGDGSERFLHRGNLSENVGTIAVLLDHTLQPANLTFNTAQAAQVGAFDLIINGDRLAFG